MREKERRILIHQRICFEVIKSMFLSSSQFFSCLWLLKKFKNERLLWKSTRNFEVKKSRNPCRGGCPDIFLWILLVASKTMKQATVLVLGLLCALAFCSFDDYVVMYKRFIFSSLVVVVFILSSLTELPPKFPLSTTKWRSLIMKVLLNVTGLWKEGLILSLIH